MLQTPDGPIAATGSPHRRPWRGKRRVSGASHTLDLFEDDTLPEGFTYQAEFQSAGEERSQFDFHGFTGKRRWRSRLASARGSSRTPRQYSGGMSLFGPRTRVVGGSLPTAVTSCSICCGVGMRQLAGLSVITIEHNKNIRSSSESCGSCTDRLTEPARKCGELSVSRTFLLRRRPTTDPTRKVR